MAIRLPDGQWNLRDEPRVAPADRRRLERLSCVVLWLIRRRTTKGRNDFNVFLTLARLGKLFPAHSIFLSQVLGKTRLSTAEKELIVLRVAWRLGCAYEWSHHRHMADNAEVAPHVIAAATTEDLRGLSPRQSALLWATDELIAQHKLTESGWAAALEQLNADEALELSLFVGHYVMIAMVINTAGVQLEPGFDVVCSSG